jgi:hypothetical protein
MEEYEDFESLLEVIKELLNKHPHLLISRQRVVKDER